MVIKCINITEILTVRLSCYRIYKHSIITPVHNNGKIYILYNGKIYILYNGKRYMTKQISDIA